MMATFLPVHRFVARGAARTTALALTGLGLLGGCGQKDPAPPATTLEPYFPLAAGSWWEYAHSDWTERVETASATFEGQDAFLMTDSPNPSDNLRSDSIVLSLEGRIARLSKAEYLVSGDTQLLTSSVTYGVGFTRFDENWANQPVGYTATLEYERIETEPDGTVRPPEVRKHTFEILSLSERITTGVGTFDCIKIQRTRDWQLEEAELEGVDSGDSENKWFWFARGIGKVREQNQDTGNMEILVDYSIPPGGG
jgi:hypothetical protein